MLLEIGLPYHDGKSVNVKDDKGKKIRHETPIEVSKDVVGIRTKMKNSIEINFE